MRPDAGFDGFCRLRQTGAALQTIFLRMETSVASAIEDLPVDDVAREDPSSGAFEVALGALHFDGNDTNAFAVGRRVPRAREGDVELPVAEYRTGKEEAGALKRLALGLVDGHGEGDAQWELAPSELEGKAGIGRLEGNTGNGDFEADELAGDDDALEEVRVDGGDDKAGTVARGRISHLGSGAA